MKLIVDIEKKLKDFTLQINFETGEGCMGIMGASGSGKSMTLKCIAGIVQPDQGKIILNDRVLFDGCAGKKPAVNRIPQKRKVGYLFQNYALFPNMTVKENIMTGLKAAKLPKEERNRISQEMLERFQITELQNRYPRQISGGQKQRCALARILACSPDVILLDEPFSALDAKMKKELQQEVAELLKQYGHPALLVSHDQEEVLKLCNHMYIIEQGKVV